MLSIVLYHRGDGQGDDFFFLESARNDLGVGRVIALIRTRRSRKRRRKRTRELFIFSLLHLRWWAVAAFAHHH